MNYLKVTIALLFLLACGSKKPVLYNYPEKIARGKKAEFIADCEKGRVLYGIHCAPCHNKVVEGKEVIPDFTPIQLEQYDLRLDEPKHKASLTERKLPQEELDLVIKFLWYKKSGA